MAKAMRAAGLSAAPSLTEAIGMVIEQSCHYWNAQDYRSLHDLWDSNEVEPWYIAEDVEAPLIGWAGIEAYWQTNLGLLERTDLKYDNLQAKTLGGDLALAIYTLHFIRKVTGPQAAPEGECRVTALLRIENNIWRFCHLVEAPISPLSFMRRLFEGEQAKAMKPAGAKRLRV